MDDAIGNVADATPSMKGVVQLAGDLAGTAASPQIAAGVITDTEVNAANKDGAAGTASMRTLGTGATQAAAGNDSRFGAGGPPSGAASGDLSGTYPAPQIAAGVIVDADVNSGAAIAESKLNLATDAAVGTGSRRTLGAGAQQAMPGNRTLDAISAAVSAVTLGGEPADQRRHARQRPGRRDEELRR